MKRSEYTTWLRLKMTLKVFNEGETNWNFFIRKQDMDKVLNAYWWVQLIASHGTRIVDTP